MNANSRGLADLLPSNLLNLSVTPTFSSSSFSSLHAQRLLTTDEQVLLDCRRLVDDYFRQLSQGCGRSDCHTSLCASSLGRNLPVETCAALSLSIATSFGDRMLCPNLPMLPSGKSTLIERSLLWWKPKPSQSPVASFIASLLTTPPWLWFFGHPKRTQPLSIPELIVHRAIISFRHRKQKISQDQSDAKVSAHSTPNEVAVDLLWMALESRVFSEGEQQLLVSMLENTSKRATLFAKKKMSSLSVIDPLYALVHHLDAQTQVVLIKRLSNAQLDAELITLLLLLLLPSKSESLSVKVYTAVATAIKSWDSAQKEGLQDLLKLIKLEHWLTLVNNLNSALDIAFNPLCRPAVAMSSMLSVMKVLYETNALRSVDSALSAETFYNQSISEQLDVRLEYQIWCERTRPEQMMFWEQKRRFHSSALASNGSSELLSYLDFPFLIDSTVKARLIHLEVLETMSQQIRDIYTTDQWAARVRKLVSTTSMQTLQSSYKYDCSPYLVLSVSRSNLATDTLLQIKLKSMNLKKPLKVRFVDGGEEGVDQGGVQKEFFPQLFTQLLNPDFGIFTYVEDTRLCWLNSDGLDEQEDLEAVGKLIGLAIYNGVHVNLPLPILFFKKLLDHPVSLLDLAELYPQRARGLQQLLEFNGDVETVFSVNFEASGLSSLEPNLVVPLVPNGSNIPVTNANRHSYVAAYVQMVLNESVARVFESIKLGFWSVAEGDMIRLCQPAELQRLLCGNSELDMNELESVAQYDDGYTPDHPTVVDFWAVVNNLSVDMQRKLLHFVTASDRLPLKGISALTFVIQRNGPDSDRLPSAQTCFGRLLLPEYASREKLQNRLTTALQLGLGFGLA